MKNNQIDHYLALGVTREADDQDIKKAYRKAAQSNHPDPRRGFFNLGDIL